jgi:hypothetical protein
MIAHFYDRYNGKMGYYSGCKDWVFLLLGRHNELQFVKISYDFYETETAVQFLTIININLHLEIKKNVKCTCIQHYVIKFVSDLRQVSDFLRVLPVSSTNKTDRHNITEILLKLALYTLTITLTLYLSSNYI